MYDAIRRGEAIPEHLLHGQGYDRLPGHQGFTPLSFAAECGNLPATQQLLDRFQPDLNRPDENGRLPLELAAGAGHAGVTQALLAAGANPLLPARDGRPVIHHAVDSGSVDTTLALVRAGGDDVLLTADRRGYGPLDRAVEVSHPEIATALCKAGAADRYRIPDGGRRAEPPGLAAARIGDPSVLAALHETGALALPSMSRDVLGRTPMHIAALENRNAAAAYLLSIGTPVDTPNKYGSTALHFALQGGSTEVLETLLLQGGADPNAGHPLHQAATFGDIAATRLLLHHGADVAHTDLSGKTALHLVAETGSGQHPGIARMLMAAGADPLKSTPRVRSPLEAAVGEGKDTLVDAMVQHAVQTHGGAVPPGLLEANRRYGDPLLHTAAAHPDPAVAARMCTALMRVGADPNAPNREGQTPLHRAAEQYPRSLRSAILTDRTLHFRERTPADVERIRTLTTAHAERFQALIAGGADPGQRDRQGRTAADLLQAEGVDPAVVTTPRAPAHHAPGAGAAQARTDAPPAAPALHYTAVMAAAAAGGAGGAGAGAAAGDAGRAAAPRPPTPTHGM